MRKIERRVRRHYGHTAKRVAVRSHRPWYFRLIMASLCVLFGFGLAFLLLRSDDYETVSDHLKAEALENQALEAKLIQAQRELQIELATNNNLAKELASVQDDNLKVKEDLFFYKNMLNKK
jgi:hypothetical protein